MKDDMISRQAALDALGERPVVWSDNDDYTLGERNQYDMDRLAIETVPPIQSGWIPCSTELPKDEEEVIVSIHDDSGDYSYDYTSFGWYAAAGEFWVVDNEANMRVVAWMPLPEPWKGGQDNGTD